MTLSKAGRRKIERAIDTLIKRDGDRCSICHANFADRAPTFYGVIADGTAAIVGECCALKLHYLFGSGIYFATANNATADEAEDVAKRAGLTRYPKAVCYSDSAWKTDDRQWFEANPERSHRLRRRFPQEADSFVEPLPTPPPGHEFQILVRQVAPGRRVRLPFCRNTAVPIPDIEPVVHALFDLYANCRSDEAGRAVSVQEVAELAAKYADARS